MSTSYKSKFTGDQIDNSVETVVSNTATEGQVLTADGAGRASWKDATGGGTEVVANPSLSGTESNLTGLEVAGTKYKVPSGGTEVVANPSLSGTESDLTGLEVAGTKYKVPTGGGTEVVANPTGEATEELTKLQVGSAVYSIPTGGSGSGTQLYKHEMALNNQLFITISKESGKYDGNAISVIIQDSIKATYNDCIILNYTVQQQRPPLQSKITFNYVSNGVINSIEVDEFTSITDTVTPL